MEKDKPANGEILRYRLDSLEEFKKSMLQQFAALKSAVNDLHTETKIANLNRCPLPGKCLELDKRLNSLEEDRRRMGGRVWDIGMKIAPWVLLLVYLGFKEWADHLLPFVGGGQ